jgi:hypothetical protein
MPANSYVVDYKALSILKDMITRLKYTTYTVQFTPPHGAVVITYGVTPNEILQFVDSCLTEGLVPAAVTIYDYPENRFQLRRLFAYNDNVEC